MEVAGELESLYETKIARLSETVKSLQIKLDDAQVLSEVREAELIAVNEATKRKIVDHCKDMLSKSKAREDDLQVRVRGATCCSVGCGGV
jgi:hypothetical protein